MEPILSKKEQEREERNKAILDEYSKLVQDFPGTKRWRILRTLGEKHSLSPEQVRNILISEGAYVCDEQPVEQD